MQKITGREERVGLLDREQFNDLFRPGIDAKTDAEKTHIPDTVLEESAEAETGSPFLRTKQRVPVRRRGGSKFGSRFSGKNRWMRLVAGAIVIAGFGLLAAIFFEAKSLLLHNRHFLLRSGEDIQVNGNRVVTRNQAVAFFASDVGKSIFRVPLAQRRQRLESIPWARLATVMRLWPNRLRVTLVERMPVAFAREGNTIRLVDDQGVLLNLPEGITHHYSFPILSGISAGDPRSLRAARVETYLKFARALDADGGHVSTTLSEVDLSDPEDVRAIFTGAPREPLVHFGNSNYLPRYRAYQSHLAEWLQQYPKLRSVDMRYGKQVVLDTGTTPATPDSASALLAGVHPQPTTANAAPAVHRKHEVAKHRTSHESVKRTAKTHRAAHDPRHRAVVHQRSHARQSRHGHIVRKPIMHVTNGL